MDKEEREWVRQLRFMPSRIPALDALEIFIPHGAPDDPEIDELRKRTGQSRWYPEAGGFRVRIPYEGGPYNAERFTLVKGAWDHEHCQCCGASIKPLTLCWVTESGPWVLLDEACYRQIFGETPPA